MSHKLLSFKAFETNKAGRKHRNCYAVYIFHKLLLLIASFIIGTVIIIKS